MGSVPVVFIAGDGRSGSTLLDRILGQAQGLVSCGEMWLAWERAFGENQLCGCNQSFGDCEFWQKVMECILREEPAFEAARVSDLQKQIMRIRHIPYLLYPKIRPAKYTRLLEEYGKFVRPVYAAIIEVSGKKAVIDSSKMPLYGMVLSAIGLDVRVIHLVRNSNAVAYSWSRKRVRPEITDRTEYMPQYSAFYSAYNWVKVNIISEILRKKVAHALRLKYEDLIRNPQDKIHELLQVLCFSEEYVSFADQNSLVLDDNHIVSGNPMRFRRGLVTIRHDDEWREEVSAKERLIVMGLTWLLLCRYGYL